LLRQTKNVHAKLGKKTGFQNEKQKHLDYIYESVHARLQLRISPLQEDDLDK